MQKFSDEPLKVCEKCGGSLEKQLSLSGFQFKGAGWYVTDYAGKKAEKGEKSEKTEKSEKSSASESTAAGDSASNVSSDKKTVSPKETASKKD